MSYNQEYIAQPTYEIDCMYSNDSDSDKPITQKIYHSVELPTLSRTEGR